MPLAALFPSAAAVQGEIRGRVMVRTAPVHPIGQQTVHLTIVERAVASEREAVTDAAGAFRFAGLPVGGIRVFVLHTEYAGVRYTTDRIVLTPTASVRTVDLAVYASSPDRSPLRAPLALAVVDVARGALRVSVIQRLENPTDRTLVSTPQDPLDFPLPPKAESVSFLAGWGDPRIANGRITDAFPLMPGRTEVAYAYGLEPRSALVEVPWTFPYGAQDVEVLVADTGLAAAADGLTARGSVQGPHGRFLRLSGGPVARGRQIVLRLRGVPLDRDPWPGAVAVGLAVVLAGGLALAWRRAVRTPT
ncbi:MAG TPA: carboxypeptidase-like regulatory domain-containing protein [bacterium]|nr:carboxypeptidase-like regulatory domain-containing protein [bacterium]